MQLINNQVDIGVRVELPAKVFEHITDVVYESKLVYRTKQYGDSVRTFCMNPYGHVVAENVEGINTVNGHSYADPALRSENTNFALLVSNQLHRALQRALPLRQAHRLPEQYAGRRRAGPALRRPGQGRAHQRAPPEPVLHPAHPHRRRPRRPVPGAAQAAAGRHHRDDLRRWTRSPPAPPTTTPCSTARRSSSTPARIALSNELETAAARTSSPSATVRAPPAAWRRPAPPASRSPGSSPSGWASKSLRRKNRPAFRGMQGGSVLKWDQPSFAPAGMASSTMMQVELLLAVLGVDGGDQHAAALLAHHLAGRQVDDGHQASCRSAPRACSTWRCRRGSGGRCRCRRPG